MVKRQKAVKQRKEDNYDSYYSDNMNSLIYNRSKLRFLGGLKMIIFYVLNHTQLQKVEYLLNKSSDLYEF